MSVVDGFSLYQGEMKGFALVFEILSADTMHLWDALAATMLPGIHMFRI